MIVVVDMTLEAPAPEDRSAVEFFATLGVLFFVGPDLGRWFYGTDMAKHSGKMVEHPQSKSTKPKSTS